MQYAKVPSHPAPWVVGEPEVAADDVFEQTSRLLLGEGDHHFAEDHRHMGEPLVGLETETMTLGKTITYSGLIKGTTITK